MITKKTVLNEDFDFNKVKKSNIADDYKIDISFDSIIELLKKKTKVYITKFLEKLGREKCKEYLEKYLNYLDDIKFFKYRSSIDESNIKVYRCHNIISDLNSVRFSAHPSEIYDMADEIIEKEDLDFIIFLCMLLSNKLYILLTGNVYYNGLGHLCADIFTIQAGNLYLYNYDEITNITHEHFFNILSWTGRIKTDEHRWYHINKIDNNINQKITITFDQDKEKFIIQTT